MEYQPKTELEKIYLHFPDENWNFDFLSSNKSITNDFIKAHPNLPWKTKYYCMNPNFSKDMIHKDRFIFGDKEIITVDFWRLVSDHKTKINRKRKTIKYVREEIKYYLNQIKIDEDGLSPIF